MGIVTQESILFNDTIQNNISFGKEGGPQRKLLMLPKSQMHMSLSCDLKSYETIIGERGSKLSGGQKQRIIARALLQKS